MQVIYHQTKCIVATTNCEKSSCDIMPHRKIKALCNVSSSFYYLFRLKTFAPLSLLILLYLFYIICKSSYLLSL